MAAAFAKGDLTGVDRIIPGVLWTYLLMSASKETREGPEHQGGASCYVSGKITPSVRTSC